MISILIVKQVLTSNDTGIQNTTNMASGEASNFNNVKPVSDPNVFMYYLLERLVCEN